MIINKEEKTSIISILLISNLFGLIVLVMAIMLKTLVWLFGNPSKKANDALFLAEKNCTTVSHEIVHEMQLRLAGHKKFIQEVHDIWTKHFYEQLEFEQYGEDFKKTNDKPMFLTMDTSQLKKIN